MYNIQKALQSVLGWPRFAPFIAYSVYYKNSIPTIGVLTHLIHKIYIKSFKLLFIGLYNVSQYLPFKVKMNSNNILILYQLKTRVIQHGCK